MAGSFFKKAMPAFIPIALELMKQFKRDTSHNNNIKKMDKTDERLSTIENLVLKVEKKALANREEIRTLSLRLQIWLALNSVLLILVVLKIFSLI